MHRLGLYVAEFIFLYFCILAKPLQQLNISELYRFRYCLPKSEKRLIYLFISFKIVFIYVIQYMYNIYNVATSNAHYLTVRVYSYSIKVVHEQSGKVEYERERLLGIAMKIH